MQGYQCDIFLYKTNLWMETVDSSETSKKTVNIMIMCRKFVSSRNLFKVLMLTDLVTVSLIVFKFKIQRPIK